jgi:DNA-binding CsgD family transcriptional regulator
MQMETADLRLATLEQIYAWTDSGDSPGAAVRACRVLLGADKAVLLELATDAIDESHDRVLATSGANDEFAAALLAARDAGGNFLSHFRSWDQDNAYDGARLLHTADLLNSDFYRTFLAPNDVQHAIAGVIRRGPANCTLLCAYRTTNDLAFSQVDIARLRELLPHWRRALELRGRLNRLNQQSDVAHCILNHAPFGILTVDYSGLVLYANHRAKVIMRLNDGLRIKDGHITTSNLTSTRKLLGELRHTMKEAALNQAVPFPLERPSGAKPYQIMFIPFEFTAAQAELHELSCGIFVYDPTHQLPVDSAALRSLEGLTDSEARLCESLYETKNLGESAEQLNVSLSTAKTHLLNTFRKLGINSQAELMRYLAHMPKISGERLQ